MDRDALVALLDTRKVEANALATNLVDLEAEPAVVLLRAGTLEGRSATDGDKAQAALARLWSDLDALRAHLSAVEAARDDGWRGDTARMSRLLLEPTIVLDTSALPAAQRSATGPASASTTLTVEQLLGRMQQDYELAASVVAALTEATNRGSSLLARARPLAAELGPVDGAELIGLVTRADEVALTDPLALSDLLAPLDAAVTAGEVVRASWASSKADLPVDLAAADALLKALEESIRVGADALAEARSKIAGAVGLLEPLDPLTLIDGADRGLRPWLERIVATAAGNWRSARAGLTAWRKVADGAVAEAARVVAANEAPLRARDELRGRVEALAAKSRARGEAERPTVAAAYRQVREVLWSAPCDLGQAQEAVDAYVGALDAPGPGTNGSDVVAASSSEQEATTHG